MNLLWARPAIADLAQIHDYIARDSPERAGRFVRKLIAAAEPLTDFPELGRVVPEGDGRHREILVEPYRVIYRFTGSDVLIVAVIHGSRDLSNRDQRP